MPKPAAGGLLARSPLPTHVLQYSVCASAARLCRLMDVLPGPARKWKCNAPVIARACIDEIGDGSTARVLNRS